MKYSYLCKSKLSPNTNILNQQGSRKGNSQTNTRAGQKWSNQVERNTYNNIYILISEWKGNAQMGMLISTILTRNLANGSDSVL